MLRIVVPPKKGKTMANRIVLTTATAGDYVSTRTLPAHVTRHNLAYIHLMLNDRLTAERAARREPSHVVTVRAWEVTPAGTHIYPPVVELSA